MAGIDDNITQLFEFANRALGTATDISGRISTFIPNISSGNLSYTPNIPEMQKPASIGDFLQPDSSSTTLRFLDGEVEKLIDQYFPEINACLRYTPEEWLCGILTGQKPFGLSKEVFEAVWHESRDREYRARNSAVEQIRTEFSNRGFSMVPGAAVGAILEAEEQSSDAIAAVNRAQTIRDAEIKLDLLKFAEEQAIRLKLGIFQAIADFYRVLMELPNKDLEASRLRVQAYASLNDALSQFYRVQLGFEDLRLQAAKIRMDGKLDESRIRVSSLDGSRNTALGQAVDAFASAAQGAVNAASTLNADIVTGSA